MSNKKLRILFVCHRFPWPPHEGGKIRPFHIIKHLHQSHEVTVASVVRNGSEMANIEGMSPHCGEVLVQRIKPVSARVQMVARLPSCQPSSFGYFHSSQLKRQIAKTAKQRKFDLIFVHCSSMAHYALQIPNTPKILDFGDMDSEKWLEYSRYRAFPISLGFSLEGKKLKKKELELAGAFDICTVTTAAELQTLSAYQAKSHCDWFSNGVDIDFFPPVPRNMIRTWLVSLGGWIIFQMFRPFSFSPRKSCQKYNANVRTRDLSSSAPNPAARYYNLQNFPV